MTTQTSTGQATETTLYMKRVFQVPREKVFQAWTSPDLLKKWFAASDDYTCPIAEVDARVEGKFRIAMKHTTKGMTHTAVGVYREVKSPERLVFTWSWEGEEENGETLVTIDFRSVGNTTEMMFKHENFPSKKVRDDHEQGWIGCFNRFAAAVK